MAEKYNYNIIHINYNLIKFEDIKEYHKLIEYVENNYNSSNTYVNIDK